MQAYAEQSNLSCSKTEYKLGPGLSIQSKAVIYNIISKRSVLISTHKNIIWGPIRLITMALPRVPTPIGPSMPTNYEWLVSMAGMPWR